MTAPHHDRGLVLIGSFKIVKALLLAGAAIGLWRLLHRDVAATIAAWTEHLRIDPDNAIAHRLVERLLGIDRRTLKAIDAGTFLYAAVFATEGVGLLLGKRWAEYFTLGVTISFIPIEVFEVVKHASVMKAIVTVINIAIAVYLVLRIRRSRQK